MFTIPDTFWHDAEKLPFTALNISNMTNPTFIVLSRNFNAHDCEYTWYMPSVGVWVWGRGSDVQTTLFATPLHNIKPYKRPLSFYMGGVCWGLENLEVCKLQLWRFPYNIILKCRYMVIVTVAIVYLWKDSNN